MEDFTLEEFVMGESPIYSVRWLVNRKFGFKTFESSFHAGNFFNEIKSVIAVVSS